MKKFKSEIMMLSAAVLVFLTMYVLFAEEPTFESVEDDVVTEQVSAESEDRLTAEEERYLEFMDHHMDELQEMSDEFDRLYDVPLDEAYNSYMYGTNAEEMSDLHTRFIYFMGKLDKLTVPPAYQAEFDQTIEELNQLDISRLVMGTVSLEVEAGQVRYYEELPRVQEMHREIIARHRL